jgi:hypothetical protein
MRSASALQHLIVGAGLRRQVIPSQFAQEPPLIPSCRFLGFVALVTHLIMVPTAQAQPPIWESAFGNVLCTLTGTDDTETSVSLSFDFRFGGTTYATVFVGTNSGLQLGSLGTTAGIFFDQWDHIEYFTTNAAPSVNGFVTDLDLWSAGTIHFNDFGDRAVFTWNAVPTVVNELAVATFQITLFPSGRIAMGWNGILDSPGFDLITDLAEGIVIGVTGGDIAQPTNPDPNDLSFVQTTSTTAFERRCFDTQDSCGMGGVSLGLRGWSTLRSISINRTSISFPTRTGSV